MKNNSVTLKELLYFRPQNDREKEIYKINQCIIDDIINKLDKDIFYLGGHIKLNYNNVINIDIFDKLLEIEFIRISNNKTYSFEEIKYNNYHKTISIEFENMFKKYFEVIKWREKIK